MAPRRLLVVQGSVVGALLAAATLFVVVNLAGAKFWMQWDWTRSGLYSLSEQTSRVVTTLNRDVRLVFFEYGASLDVLEQIRTVLHAYAGLNPARVKVETIDPRRDPLRAQAALASFNINPLRDPVDVVVIEAGQRTKQLRIQDLVEYDLSAGMGGPPPVKALKVEAGLTAAILAVTRERRPIVRFAAGHGEREPQEQNEAGLSRFAEALTRQDIEVATWNAVGAREVPADTDLVVVAAPTTPWLPTEREALAQHLDRGGRALLLLEPILRSSGAAGLVPSGLESLAATWGVTIHDDFVIDPARGVPLFGAETFFAAPIGLHPITTPLARTQLLWILGRSLASTATPPSGVLVNALVETSADAWGETDLGRLREVAKDDRDQPGPLTLAFAVERTPPADAPASGPRTRLVITGDVEAAANAGLDSLANRSFVLNSVAWLLDEQRALGIAPKDRTLSRLFLTRQQLTSLGALLIVLLPVLAITAGLGVWWRRKRA